MCFGFSIIGVVQMVNKMDGVFNRADEESFETFAIYCGLALHHAKVGFIYALCNTYYSNVIITVK